MIWATCISVQTLQELGFQQGNEALEEKEGAHVQHEVSKGRKEEVIHNQAQNLGQECTHAQATVAPSRFSYPPAPAAAFPDPQHSYHHHAPTSSSIP
jgi:hypothetical protein